MFYHHALSRFSSFYFTLLSRQGVLNDVSIGGILDIYEHFWECKVSLLFKSSVYPIICIIQISPKDRAMRHLAGGKNLACVRMGVRM